MRIILYVLLGFIVSKEFYRIGVSILCYPHPPFNIPLSCFAAMFIRYILNCAFLLITLFFFQIGSFCSQAYSQEIFESEPFGFRTEPSRDLSKFIVEPFDYKGEPLAFHSFRIWPNLTLQQDYTDNVLAIENNTQNDFITTISPDIEVWKSFGRHDFSLRLNNEIKHYQKRHDDNVENYNISFNGNFEALKKLNFPVQIAYKDGHLNRIDQRRTNPNQIVKTPLNVKNFETQAGVVYNPNRIELSFLGKYQQIRLGNEALINGGFIRRDKRNVNITAVSGEATYNIKNGLSPFLRMAYSKENYINESVGAVSRNNNLSSLLSGFKLNYKGLIKGFLGAGVEDRSYDDPAVKDTTDFSFGSEIEWEPIVKTRLSLNALRATSEDNILISGLTETSAGLKIQHEIQKDLFGRASINYGIDDFKDFSRTDKRLDLGLEILKMINPHLQIGVGYNYTKRESSIPGLGMNNNVISLKIKTAL